MALLKWMLLGASSLVVACQADIAQEKLIRKTERRCQEAEVQSRFLVQWQSGVMEEVEFSDEQSLVESFIRPQVDRIDYVEPVYRLERPTPGPREEIIPESFVSSWAISGIGVQYAWDRGLNGMGVRIAVIDTGIDIDHPQLRNSLMINEAEANGIQGYDDDQNGYVDDIYGWNFAQNSAFINDESGHGTHVAGIIAADHARGEIKGVAPKSKILAVDFMDRDGGTSSQAIKAVDYALSRGVDIINASWTTEECSFSLQQAFRRWEKEPVLFVTAAGNSNINLNLKPEYPPSFRLENQLTVGAVDFRGALTSFTNYGQDVQVYAPGDYIHSLEPASVSPTGIGYRKGTSMSAGFASGQAALILQAAPHLGASEVRRIIVETSDYGGRSTRTAKIRVDRSLRYLGL